jgi:ABC-type nitrate/sulfonate/bicarbonate transport system permease component
MPWTRTRLLRLMTGKSATAIRTAGPVMLGVGLLGISWEVAASEGWLGTSFPRLNAVLRYAVDLDSSRVVWESLRVTLASALGGILIGFLTASAAVIVSFMGKPWFVVVERFSVTLHAIPLIAFAPVLITLLEPHWAPLIAAALAAYYPIYVSLSSAVVFSPPVYADLATSLGSNRQSLLAYCIVPHAMPNLIDGLRLAIPAAILGAILGEWFGAPRGIGVIILAAMQNFQLEQLWCAALAAAASSMVLYVSLAPLHHRARDRFIW